MNQERILGYFFLWVILLFVAVSCNFDNARKSTSPEKNDVTEAFSAGQWKILAFKKDGREIENNYKSCLFHFADDHKISIIRGDTILGGQWCLESSDGGDDAPDSDINFIITADSNSTLSELTASWQIVQRTRSMFMLNKVSRTGKTIDSLIFQKK